MRILIVEDELDLADWLVRALSQSGFVPDHVPDASSARAAVLTTSYDAIVLDLNLPDEHGLLWLKELRANGNTTAILILTAQGALDDRVRGLNLGADDFLAKPFALAELEARLTALGRRQRQPRQCGLSFGGLTFDEETRTFTATATGNLIPLTPRERAALTALMHRKGQPVTKSQLFDKVFEMGSDAGPEAIEVVMHRLRRKLADYAVNIVTIRGLGYMLKDDTSSPSV